MITALNRCIIAIERIQDYVEHLSALSRRAAGDKIARLAAEDHERMLKLYDLAIRALAAVADSFESDASRQNFDHVAAEIHTRVEAFERFNLECREYFAERSWRKGRGMLPSQGLFVDACAKDLEEIVRHADAIAGAESRAEFFFKSRKLSRVTPPISGIFPSGE